MKVIYTDGASESLEDAMDFMLNRQKIPAHKVTGILEALLDRADRLVKDHGKGQYEPDLEHLGKGHRRVVQGNFKIIYTVKNDAVVITDFFHTRQDTTKMKA